jgi:serine/threonine protein kinase
MEYADGGDLLMKIFEYKKKGCQFKEEEIWDIFMQIVKGLTALHELKILHRDIKVPYSPSRAPMSSSLRMESPNWGI